MEEKVMTKPTEKTKQEKAWNHVKSLAQFSWLVLSVGGLVTLFLYGAGVLFGLLGIPPIATYIGLSATAILVVLVNMLMTLGTLINNNIVALHVGLQHTNLLIAALAGIASNSKSKQFGIRNEAKEENFH